MARRNGLSQLAFLRRHLAQGNTITRLQGMHYGIANLTARIADLRNEGWQVDCEWRQDAEGAEYGVFSLTASERPIMLREIAQAA
jgi:hypothetical protein